MKPARILVFEHMKCQNPGVFRGIARDHGVTFTEVDLHGGDAIPDVSAFDGLWAMGGSMDVWQEEEFPWLGPEKAAIRHAVADLGMPFLGICFGHQLLAEAMGGTAAPSRRAEIGLSEVRPTAEGAGHRLLAGLPDPTRWANAHTAEVVSPPPCATVLAESRDCPIHMMQAGPRAYSVQFHPEVTHGTVDDWLTIPGIPDVIERECGVEAFRASIHAHLPAHNKAAAQLMANWLALVS